MSISGLNSKHKSNRQYTYGSHSAIDWDLNICIYLEHNKDLMLTLQYDMFLKPILLFAPSNSRIKYFLRCISMNNRNKENYNYILVLGVFLWDSRFKCNKIKQWQIAFFSIFVVLFYLFFDLSTPWPCYIVIAENPNCIIFG